MHFQLAAQAGIQSHCTVQKLGFIQDPGALYLQPQLQLESQWSASLHFKGTALHVLPCILPAMDLEVQSMLDEQLETYHWEPASCDGE